MLATMIETPEKAAPMTPVTGGIPATGRGADALFQPPSVDEVGEEQGCKVGRKVGPINEVPIQSEKVQSYLAQYKLACLTGWKRGFVNLVKIMTKCLP